MKRRWKLLIGLGGILAFLAITLFVIRYVRPAGELEAYKNRLIAQGEKLDLRQLQPPPVAPEDNAAEAVKEAFGYLDSSTKVPEAMKMVAPGKALTGWQQSLVRGNDFTNSWEDFAAGMAAEQPAIDLLHQVLVRPKLDFALDYRLGAKMSLPHLATLKRCAQLLEAATVWNLHQGDSGAAVTNILVSLALVKHNEQEGVLVSHMVRIIMLAIAASLTWEMLQATNLTDAQLATVQNGWQQLDLLRDAGNAFATERVFYLNIIQTSRTSHEYFKELTGYASSTSGGGDWPEFVEEWTKGPRLAVGEMMWRSSWSYQEELKTLKTDQVILETVRAMQTNHSQFYLADYDAMGSRLSALGYTKKSGSAVVRALKIPDLRGEFSGSFSDNTLRRTLKMEAARRIVITAMALRRYQLKQGQWPAVLDDLAPEFLASVPIDPYDGKPLRYHPNADGTYRLYGVGEDGVDNGGRPAAFHDNLYWLDRSAPDWVWPQPATPTQVQAFREHPPN